jgi:flagellin
MNVTYEHLARIRDLCVQVANGIYSTTNRSVILDEIKQRIEDIDTQAKSMNFNGVKLLDGSVPELVLQVGAGSDNATNSIDVGPVLPDSTVDKTASGNGLDIYLKVTTGTPIDATWANIADWDHDSIMSYMDKIDVAINDIVSRRSSLGAYMSRLEGTYDNINTTYTNLTESNSRIVDLDYAQASSDMIKYQILQQVSTSVLAQANTVPQMALSLLQ